MEQRNEWKNNEHCETKKRSSIRERETNTDRLRNRHVDVQGNIVENRWKTDRLLIDQTLKTPILLPSQWFPIEKWTIVFFEFQLHL